jgi:uncharacterized protein (TIGR02145 family)
MKNLLVFSVIIMTAFCVSCDKNNLPEVQTLSYEFVTMDSVLLTGEATGEADDTVTSRGFCWATHATPTVSDHFSENGMGSGVFSARIGSLEIGQEYHFRSYAVNVAGMSYGGILSFRFEFPVVSGTLTDVRDNKVYKTVVIGKQTWMAENLAYMPILFGTDMQSSPFYAVPMFGTHDGVLADAKASPNYVTYGVLYNYPAAVSACPQGWHLPAKEEFEVLLSYVGSLGYKKMKSTTHWTPYGNGDNSIGWNAYPAGTSIGYPGNYTDFGAGTSYWTATTRETEWFPVAWKMNLSFMDRPPYIDEGNSSAVAFSVRCIKDH